MGCPPIFRARRAKSAAIGKNVFRGATKVTLDAKGRLAIPTRYRERLAARCDGQIIVTVDKDHCLLVYPLPDWEELERKLVRLPSMNKAARRIVRIMVGYATEVDMDGSGRILVRPSGTEPVIRVSWEEYGDYLADISSRHAAARRAAA